MKLKLLKRIVLNKGALWLSSLKLIAILQKLDRNSIVIDCGANIGEITKKFAATGARVYAFEPDPLAFRVLQKRCKNFSNVVMFEKGVWDKETQIILYTHKDQEKNDLAFTVGSSIVGSKINVDIEKKQIIDVVDLSAFIRSLGKKVSVIKLDVEGAEIEILKKILHDETYKLFDTMYVETHETKIPGHKAELEIIRKSMKDKNVVNIKLNWL